MFVDQAKKYFAQQLCWNFKQYKFVYTAISKKQGNDVPYAIC